MDPSGLLTELSDSGLSDVFGVRNLTQSAIDYVTRSTMSMDQFRADFQGWTGGQSVGSVQAVYYIRTGSYVPEEHLFTLFNDPFESMMLINRDENYHTELRYILNGMPPSSFTDGNWTELTKIQSMFHCSFGCGYRKFVSTDGHREWVTRGEDTSKIIYDTRYMGTFNYFGPSNWYGQTMADVIPYKFYGHN